MACNPPVTKIVFFGIFILEFLKLKLYSNLLSIVLEYEIFCELVMGSLIVFSKTNGISIEI